MKIIATCWRVGYISYAPGTAGSVVGWILYCLIPADPLIKLAACLIVTAGGVFSSGVAARQLGEEDPREIVIDEVAGMMIALLWLPHNFILHLSAFFLFRFFDIFKPGFIRKAEDLPGGWGIMMDDVCAGLVTNLILFSVLTLFS